VRCPSAPGLRAVNGDSAEEKVMEYTGPLTGPLPKRLVDSVQGAIAGLRSTPLVGRLVSRHLTVVTYTGRRSGRTFSTPVVFRKVGDTVTISVEVPQRKKWWRNFTGEGGPLSMELNGVERAGHAVAAENGKGKVIITVRLSN
jgi:F420H(2)-dependent quinone reductase